MIITTTVDNSPASTGDSSNPYVCDDTSDKVFALSYSEATNSSYGFSSSGGRLAYATDYAKQKGVYVNGGALYWLRSPYSDGSGDARYVNYDGYFYYGVSYDDVGVRPAFRIKIS